LVDPMTTEPRLVLDGRIARATPPYEDDDCGLHPALGLGVVARGLGATGHQGRPAAKLAVWSVMGELACATEATLEQRLHRGLARAEVAVHRLAANWPEGLIRPLATLAAVLLDGNIAHVVHVGDCGVAWLDGERIVPLTQPHTLGIEMPEAPPAVARAVTRALGRGGEPMMQQLAVQPGDVLLLSTVPWPIELAIRGSDLEEHAASLAGCGHGTVIVVRIAERAVHPLAGGSSRPPALPWLFRKCPPNPG
jgi:Protein phosphatase 2C